MKNHKFVDSGMRCLVYHSDGQQCLMCKVCGEWVKPSQVDAHGQDKLDMWVK